MTGGMLDNMASRRLLAMVKGDVVRELDVTRVLPQLVHKKVFTLAEERDILSSADPRFRAELFVDRLASKGPDAFQSFCVELERCCPRLLTRFVVMGRLRDNLNNNNVPPKEPSSEMTTAYDAVVKERDGVERMARLLKEDLETSRRQYGEMKTERDEALSALENLRNQMRLPPKSSSSPDSHQNGGLIPEHQPQISLLADPPGASDQGKEGGEKILWENHSVVLNRVPNFGFGVAVTGGKDNPQFGNGDPAIVISDVLKGGPADGTLYIGDRILSVNNIPLDSVEHAVAISLLKESGATAVLVIRRRVTLMPDSDFEQPFKITLNKKNKKDEYGIVLGYKLYVKEIIPNSLAAQEGKLKEGDVVIKLNNTAAENLSLTDARKQIEKSKDRLQLVTAKTGYKRVVNNILPSSGKQSSLKSPRQQQPADSAALGDALSPRPEEFESASPRPAASAELDRLQYPPPDRHSLPVETEPLRQGQAFPGDSFPRPSTGSLLPPQSIPDRDYPSLPGGMGYISPFGTGPMNDYRPASHDYSGAPLPSGYGHGRQPSYPQDDLDGYRRSARETPEPRIISFKKDGGVGIRVSGGNRTGIFVARVAPNTPAERQGLCEGDLILKVNDVDMRGKTREEAVLFLLSLHDHITLLVQRSRPEYERLVAEGGTGDLFYIRTHFGYDVTEHGELSFRRGDIFQITDTLYSGVVGSWQAIRVARTPQEAKKGIIPNLSRAEQICICQSADKQNLTTSTKNNSRGGGSSFFKKKTSWRAKSLGHENWDDAVFVGGKSPTNAHHRYHVTKYPAYERVIMRDVGFVRPVVIFGPLADVARERLVREHSDWFELPKSDVFRDAEGRVVKSGIIRLNAIREIIDKRRHAVLDVTPNAVDRLNYAQYAPIVVYLKAESKHSVKELRQHWMKNSSKSPRKLYEYGLRLEKSCSHLFTNTVALTNGEMWYKKLKEAIEKAQLEKIWMSETKPEPLKDDVLFPMNRRLSFISSPESDMEAVAHGPYSEDEAELMRPPHDPSRSPATRLMRSTSDPSIGAADNIPGSGPFYAGGSPPYGSDFNQQRQYRLPGGQLQPGPGQYPSRREWGSSAFDDDRYAVPRPRENGDFRGQLGHSPRKSTSPYGGRPQRDHYYRPAVDPYATLTPSERMRYQSPDVMDRRYGEPFYPGQPPYESQVVRPAHVPPPQPSPPGPPGSMGVGPQPSTLDHLKLPPQAPGDLGRYPYRTDRGSLNYDQNSNDPRFNTGSSFSSDSFPKRYSNPPGRYDGLNVPERHLVQSGPPPSAHHPQLDEPYRDSLKPLPSQTPDYSTFGSGSYRNPDRLSRGPVQPDSTNREPLSARSYERQSTDSWRAKSDTNLSRQPQLSYPSAIQPPKADQNPRSEITQQEKLENNLRNQYPYGSTSFKNLSSAAPSSIAPGFYTEGVPTVPPAKPPHVNYSQYNGRPAAAPTHLDSSPSTGRYPSTLSGTQPPPRGGTDQQSRLAKDDRLFVATTRPSVLDNNQSVDKQREHPNSAFESYRKPDSNSSTSSQQRESLYGMPDDSQTVIATARGVFDSNGGVLDSKETGVAVVIPKGAIPEGVKQEIYFKVCQDNNILPPLDKEKGETLLSPLVMCGPHGLKFLQPVELRLPHSASVNPESWSFALKSSDSPSGHPTHWQNIALAGTNGVSQGKVTKNSVTVLVDHF